MPGETQLREIFDALGDGVFVADAEGRYIDANRAGCAMMGYEREALLSLRLPDLLDPSEHARLPGAIASYAEGAIRRSEWRFRRADASTFFGELVGGRLPDGRFQSVVRDISDRRAREAHERMLAHEATHRTKNILLVVQAVARQSAGLSPDSFLSAFEARIAAMAASHELFVSNAWAPVDLEALIRAQLAPFASGAVGRLMLDGPPVTLGASAAQSLGMALHELATNAAKYGALSGPEGRVAITWRTESEATAPLFTLMWRESGGPPVSAPRRRGFGTRMIEDMVQRALDARARTDYDATGIVWTLTCSLDALLLD